VTTRTECVDVAWAGDTAVTEVSEFTVKLDAATAPKRIWVAPVNPVPVMRTLVPPLVDPEAGAMEMTAGAAVV
jgi:hypothetical protein